MSYLYTSNDGLCRSDNKEFIDVWNKSQEDYRINLNNLIIYLKSIGVKALHPDDGWVDRKENYITFTYPRFLMNIEVGDKIALGDVDNYRIVIVTDIVDFFNKRYYFKPLNRRKKNKSVFRKMKIIIKSLIR